MLRVHTYHSLWAVVGAMQPLLPPGLVHGGEVGVVKECHVSQQLTIPSANQADAQVSLLTVSTIQTFIVKIIIDSGDTTFTADMLIKKSFQ